MVQLVDGLDLATDVELLDGLVQVDDGRVLGVTAKDQLTLLLPKIRATLAQVHPKQERHSVRVMRKGHGLSQCKGSSDPSSCSLVKKKKLGRGWRDH